MRRRLGANYWRLWAASVISNLGDGVSVIAYPWLASSLTRSPLHIAAVTVMTRLPWLLFALPAGVITDRVDRRKLAAWMDVFRFGLTLLVAFAVLSTEALLSSPDEIAAGAAAPPSDAGWLLVIVYTAALLLGTAEVFRDNAAQTLMPSIVDSRHLETANGRLWGAELVMNAFVGPPLAGVLIAVAFSLPFFLDAGSFAVAAALVFLIAGDFRPKRDDSGPMQPASFRADLKEGVRWLWKHPLFKPMAIALGVLNGTSMMALATFVLFAQEILDLNATEFGLLNTGVALGGVIGSLIGHRVSSMLGQGRALFTSIIVMTFALLASGLTSSFWVFWVMGLLSAFSGTVWNVITVSLRQSLIPDRILGRVNSVYRFIGWGTLPIGSLLGGIVVTVVEPSLGRDLALRMPFLVATAISLWLLVYARTRLSSTTIDEARQRATSS